MQSDESIIAWVKVEVALAHPINEANATMTMLNQTLDCLVRTLDVVYHQRGKPWMIGVHQHHGQASVLETCCNSVVGIKANHQDTICLALLAQFAKLEVPLLIALHSDEHQLSSCLLNQPFHPPQ